MEVKYNSSTAYTHQQIIFALNSVANNLTSERVGSVEMLEKEAKQLITEIFSHSDIINLIGKWKVVWGPKVFERPGLKVVNVADNTMYVAQSSSDPNQFVVAISGTNPISVYGWVVEDAEIVPPKPWPYGTQSTSAMGNITHGTYIGMNVLLNDLKDDGQTFVKYLAEQVSNNQGSLSVTVTGHSLGGALSPATALALLDSQGVSLDEPNGWDPESKSQISVMATAGPTPGDEVWADYYDIRIGGKTNRIWNTIDIVPHGWQISMLNQIPGINYEGIPQPSFVKDFVKGAVGLAHNFENKAGSKIKQICASVPGFEGKVNLKKKKLKKFIRQMLYQHTKAYHENLGTTDFNDIVNDITRAKTQGCKCVF